MSLFRCRARTDGTKNQTKVGLVLNMGSRMTHRKECNVQLYSELGKIDFDKGFLLLLLEASGWDEVAERFCSVCFFGKFLSEIFVLTVLSSDISKQT